MKDQRTIDWFTDSPDAGDPLCTCSWCGLVITDEDAPAIRLFDHDMEARFHQPCFNEVYRLQSTPAQTIHLHDPTNLVNYVDGPAGKMPVYWMNDVTGQLPAAVHAFYEGDPFPSQLRLVIQYIQHHIHAPCWIYPDIDEEYEAEIHQLRALSKTLKTIQDVRDYISRSLDIGLGPL